MSVVNKMLQDLEARQSQTDELNADYHPPQKKQARLWILLFLTFIIAAIIFALIFNSLLVGESKKNVVMASANTRLSPPIMTKEMTVVPLKSEQPKQAKPQMAAVKPSKDKPEKVNADIDITLKSNVLTDKKTPPSEITKAADNLIDSQNIDTQNKQSVALKNTQLNFSKSPEQTPNFSMHGNSQKNTTSRLKQRIAQSLNNNELDLAQSLLSKLLTTEPNNIKARKKSASLLFAQGNYAQSKQLLIQGLKLHPIQSDLRLMLARLYVVQKEPLKAMTLLAEFQPSTDNPIEYLAYRAALAQQLKQTTLAKSDYQTLTKIEYSNAKWWLGLAITSDQLGEMNMALKAYNKAYSLGQLQSSVNDFIQQRISVLAGAQ
jgi:MSHA biogenesis protein MshN